MNDKNFPRVFLDSGRLGIYFRVENEGAIQAGDTFELLDRPAHGITVEQLWQTVFRQRDDRQTARQALKGMPYLDSGWQRRLRALL